MVLFVTYDGTFLLNLMILVNTSNQTLHVLIWLIGNDTILSTSSEVEAISGISQGCVHRV
jgi:hypothetical protein